MRGAPPAALPTSTSLSTALPEPFVANPFTAGLVQAFDDAYAPIVATLDDLAAYIDPRYAPDDFLRWVASWLSPTIARRREPDELRADLPALREALLARGTLHGVAAAVRACTGLEPTVRDSGGVSWSRRPNGELPGSATPLLEVHVRLHPDEPDPEAVLDLVRRVVDDVTPAHVATRVRRASDG